MVHHKALAYHKKRLQGKLAENGCHLVSLQRFEPLATRLFIGASYASAARYPMDDRDVINIGLRIIKCCGMYAKEYKNWISCKNAAPQIADTINSFKEYWGNAIAPVNQTAVPAL